MIISPEAKWAMRVSSVLPTFLCFSPSFAPFTRSESTFLDPVAKEAAAQHLVLCTSAAQWMDGFITLIVIVAQSVMRKTIYTQSREAKGRLALAANGKGLTPTAFSDTDRTLQKYSTKFIKNIQK
jgi:hypothetical protein